MKNIKELYKEKKMNRAELSRVSGVPYETIRRAEISTNEMENASVMTLCRFAVALGTPVSEFCSTDCKKLKRTLQDMKYFIDAALDDDLIK